ncbi:hypothetical protein ACWIUD_05770 [Helicobacter sp. 23-1044]
MGGGNHIEILSINRSHKNPSYPLHKSIKIQFINDYPPKKESKILRKLIVFFYKIKFLAQNKQMPKTREILWLLSDKVLRPKLQTAQKIMISSSIIRGIVITPSQKIETRRI